MLNYDISYNIASKISVKAVNAIDAEELAKEAIEELLIGSDIEDYKINIEEVKERY